MVGVPVRLLLRGNTENPFEKRKNFKKRSTSVPFEKRAEAGGRSKDAKSYGKKKPAQAFAGKKTKGYSGKKMKK